LGEIVEIEITEKKENQLLNRTEIKFRVDHPGTPTPTRLEVKAQLATKLGVNEEVLVLEKIAGIYGRQSASGIARVYNSKEELEKLEPKYLLVRGLPKEEAEPAKKPEKEKPPKEKEKAPPKKHEEKEKPEKARHEKMEKETPPKEKQKAAPKKQEKEKPEKAKHEEKTKGETPPKEKR
jgi:small subunit ribosomal protein S24e